MDEWLRSTYPNEDVSLGLLGAHYVNRVTGRAIFHCNCAALARFEVYKALLNQEYEGSEATMIKQGLTSETILYNLTNQKARLAAWAEAPNGQWIAKHLPTRFGNVFQETPDVLRADSFIYPGRYFNGPNGAITSCSTTLEVRDSEP